MSRPVGRLHEQTRQFLSFLRRAPLVRAQICAPKDGTLLYSGKMMRNAWEEIAELRERGALPGLTTLPEVLANIPAPETGHATLQRYTEATCQAVPWEDDGFIIWRALSGIFAAQAEGRVSFYIGAGISADNDDLARRKVFAVTELRVLARNPRIDTLTRDVLGYYLRCVENRNHAMSFSFIGGGC
ncbi:MULTISPECIES: hypothetical protein [unclassified Massilia]|uniref:hypothetical protein n=1 Tax=unclassified Massilia TaxID=2609279 RepID=UPI00177F03C6|nr:MULTISPECIES: hypothetical protein [unclassified Massilia]MBD8528374.1 hypothetical protein [Massilia sp. CFBP 13647]MBD8672004.1 hypothetical protein [Massilia sp. CFBP 13721]